MSTRNAGQFLMSPILVLLLASLSSLVSAFAPLSSPLLLRLPPSSHGHGLASRRTTSMSMSMGPTALFAHHPQKKAIKKIMHRRPKKHRPSDINRRNVNLNKSIHNFPGAPPDYTILTPEEFELRRGTMIDVWEAGSPWAEKWNATELIPQELVDRLPQNRGSPVELSPIPPRKESAGHTAPGGAPLLRPVGHVQGRIPADASRMLTFPRRMGVTAPPLSELRREVAERQKLRQAQRQAWRSGGRMAAVRRVPPDAPTTSRI